MNNILSWLTLKKTRGIGNHLYKRLIDHFKTPENVFKASPKELCTVEGIYKKQVAALGRQKTSDAEKKEIDLANKYGFHIITLTDEDYPPLLTELPDPPPYIYVYGTLDSTLPCISAVGSRNASTYGLSSAHRLCTDLSKKGFQIVSGMARGIDTAAHKAAIHAGGKTIAVLGSGLGVIYPPENRELFHKIAKNGAAISEFDIMSRPEAHNFPMRNRVICGLSLGTLVVEASRKSGSLITARLAAEQGREVFAVPGSIRSNRSCGSHALLKQGAKLVENVTDITEEVEHFLMFDSFASMPESKSKKIISKIIDGRATPVVNENKTSEKVLLNDEEVRVLNALEPYPMHIDILSRKLSLESCKLSSILLKLEIKGIVIQSPGKLFLKNEEDL